MELCAVVGDAGRVIDLESIGVGCEGRWDVPDIRGSSQTAYFQQVRIRAMPSIEGYILAIVLTVFKAVEGPFLRVRVTAPVAPVQVRLKAWPAVMELKDGLVN